MHDPVEELIQYKKPQTHQAEHSTKLKGFDLLSRE